MTPIIITTTGNIEGYHIVRYLDMVRCTRVVNKETDLSDLFGGFSAHYRNKINHIYSHALQELRMKSASMDADAVVGLHVEMEDISSKGKTRFLISLIGTAVKLDRPIEDSDPENQSVSFELLHQQQMTNQLRKKLEDDDNPITEEDWDNIFHFSLFDLAPILYKRYLLISKEVVSAAPLAEKKLLLDRFIPFLQNMRYEDAADVVYGDTTTDPYCMRDVVKACQLFHPAKIVEMLQPENKHLVISLLDTDKSNYTLEDLKLMRKIEDFLDNLPDTGHYEEGRGRGRGALLSKNGTVLVCERGHSTAVELGGHCTMSMGYGLGICDLNVKGLTQKEVAAVKNYKEKVDILESLLQHQNR